MKFKTILMTAVIIIFVFVIYLVTLDRKVYFLDINDTLLEGKTYGRYIENYLQEKGKLEKYIYHFSEQDYRITDLIRDIEDNRVVKIKGHNQTIKNALIKADFLVLNIGKNDIYYKLNSKEEKEIYDYIDQVMKDYDILMSLVRQYCKEDIVVFNFYTKDNPFLVYTNMKIEHLKEKYNIQILDMNKLLTDVMINENELNEEGQKVVAESLKKILEKKVLNS